MLAIVIPYYKYTFFESTLISLKNQTNKIFTVYIGNDASPENPIELIEKYKNEITCYYKKFDSNLGSISLTKQWERCIAEVKDEEWVVVLGDDDIFDKNFVQEFYKSINEVNNLGINVIRYATIVIDEAGEKTSRTHKHPKFETSTDFLMRKLKGGTRSSLSEFVFRKKILNIVKFKDLPLAWYSDYLAVLECSNFSTIYTINDSVVSFRNSGLNITSKNDNLIIKNIATFNFYYCLLKRKSLFFNKKEKSKLYFRLEKTFLDNKKNPNFWIKLSSLYIINLKIKRYLTFILKVLNSAFKKNKND